MIKKKILLVDDSPEMRWAFERVLTEMGFEVTSRENPKQALADFGDKIFDFDCVLTDNDMPGMSGVAFITVLRDRAYWKPVVMVSGSVDPDVQNTVERLKAKFFDKLNMRAAVESLL